MPYHIQFGYFRKGKLGAKGNLAGKWVFGYIRFREGSAHPSRNRKLPDEGFYCTYAFFYRFS